MKPAGTYRIYILDHATKFNIVEPISMERPFFVFFVPLLTSPSSAPHENSSKNFRNKSYVTVDVSPAGHKKQSFRTCVRAALRYVPSAPEQFCRSPCCRLSPGTFKYVLQCYACKRRGSSVSFFEYIDMSVHLVVKKAVKDSYKVSKDAYMSEFGDSCHEMVLK